MKTIKTYEDFVNEEINLKKALATGALAAGMAFSNPAISQTTNIKSDTTLSQRVSNPLVIKKTTLGELKSDSIKGYYLDENNIWKNIIEKSYHSDFENIGSIKSESLEGYDKILLTNKYYQYGSSDYSYFIMYKKDFDIVTNLPANKIYRFDMTKIYLSSSNQYEFDKKIKSEIEKKNTLDGYYKLYIKIGYSKGNKIVRFIIASGRRSFDFEKAYYEAPYNEFIKLFKKVDTNKTDVVDVQSNPIVIVSNISKDQVSDIKNYETSTSIKLPKEFDPNNAYMKSSFLWNSNIPQAPLGGIIFIHSDKISFFIDIKSDFKWRGDLGVDNWVKQSSDLIEYAKIPMYTGSEGYTQQHKGVDVSKGEVEHKKIINFGLASTIQKNKELNLKAYLGCGIFNTEKEIVTMIDEYTYTYYHWGHGIQDNIYDSNYYTKYTTVKEYNTKLNVTGGLLFDFASGFSMGVGFDTNPGGINLSLGFNIRK